MTVEVREYSMKDIIPACIMEQLHKETNPKKFEEEQRIKELQEKEIERKNNIIKNIINAKNVITLINNILKEEGSIEITTGRFDAKSHGIDGSRWWYLNDVHYSNCQYNLVKDVYNDELVLALYDLYKSAGYKVHIYEYSKSYYKNWNLTIKAETNCDTCEV